MAKKRYELSSGTSSKFWEIDQKGKTHTVTYGRIGSAGRSVTKEFESTALAKSSAEKLIEQKTAKGYQAVKSASKRATKATRKKSATRKAATKKATRKKVATKRPKLRKAIRLPRKLADKVVEEKSSRSKNKQNKKRLQQLDRQCGKQLAKSIKTHLIPEAKSSIDFMMFYPPENGDYINILVEVDHEEWPWDFQIMWNDWAIGAERRRRTSPEDLYPTLVGFFQTTWKTVTAKNVGGYLRIHEDSSAVDLSSGKKVPDDKRKDKPPLFIRPYKKKQPGYRKRKVKPTKLKFGWSLKKVMKHIKATKEPYDHPIGSIMILPEKHHGLHLMFNDDETLRGINAEPEFKESIEGVYFGMHVTDVESLLGLPAEESIEYHRLTFSKKQTYRRWSYPDRCLFLGFCSKDTVLYIQHFESWG